MAVQLGVPLAQHRGDEMFVPPLEGRKEAAMLPFPDRQVLEHLEGVVQLGALLRRDPPPLQTDADLANVRPGKPFRKIDKQIDFARAQLQVGTELLPHLAAQGGGWEIKRQAVAEAPPYGRTDLKIDKQIDFARAQLQVGTELLPHLAAQGGGWEIKRQAVAEAPPYGRIEQLLMVRRRDDDGLRAERIEVLDETVDDALQLAKLLAVAPQQIGR